MLICGEGGGRGGWVALEPDVEHGIPQALGQSGATQFADIVLSEM